MTLLPALNSCAGLSIAQIDLKHFRGIPELHVEFPTAPGLYRVTGENRVDPSLGSNGVGKTTFFDAITWALTGATGAGLHGSQVLDNSGQPARVQVTLADGRTLLRQQTPNRLQFAGNEVDQAALERLLPLDLWRTAVHHAQGEPFFLDLGPGDRAATLASWLRVEVWDRATEAAKAQRQQAERASAEAEQAHARALGMLTGYQASARRADDALGRAQAALADVRAESAARLEEIARALQEAEVEQADLESLAEQVETEITGAAAAAEASVHAAAQQRDRWQALRHRLQDQERVVTELESQRANIGALRTCPTCLQEVGSEHRQRVEVDLLQKLEKVQVQVRRAREAERRAGAAWKELDAQARKAAQDEQQARVAQGRRAEAARAAATRVAQLRADRDRAGSDQAIARAAREVQEAENARASLLEESRAAERAATEAAQAAKAARGLVERWDRWAKHFPQIRVWALLRAVDHFNLALPRYLADFGLAGWTARLELISQRVQQRLELLVSTPAHPDPLPVASVSGGEQQRLRLAVQLAFAELAAGGWGIEFWDEPSSYLSGSGLEDLMQSLKDYAQARRRIVWVVDHHVSDLAMDRVLTLVKTSSGVSASWTR